ncbi:MAG TPA: response regulator transcription factor [Actinomycetota bacterium]|nr:response regulator transcription factor [Actinomycetota bacterium]
MSTTRSGDAIRILIADDTPDIRLLLKMSLSRVEGFEVVGEAVDGQEAIDLVRSHHPDAVILDLAMPRVDGLQAISTIRASSPGTKIIVFSGFEATRMMSKALELGAHGYIEKSTSLSDLKDQIRTICRAA